ncbi:MAG: bifunctional phosphopantothenoylcysteine decarboxylase/phosphopantothenate--cysteine ligase CoaBC [Gammaproteobacteria bacterium]|nr:bifunctional phosphopantothenoylcysteine decarboxylase/phosphopantothenate--cysteine ligase CoaBC [Gammaproteobacteria bacterium]
MTNTPMHILLGITGSIAAYKAPELIRLLRQAGHEVKVVLTRAGKEFVTPLTLQAVCGEAVFEHLLDPTAEASMNHIHLARWADCLLIAPASAHFIAKLTHGFADDLLSTLCLAAQAPLFLAPAMNQAMWSHPATQENVRILVSRGVRFIGPDEGIQACGESGYGRMTEPANIVSHLVLPPPFLRNQRILITAGPTQEAIDPVRYLSNRSSGKMGYALAQVASAAGAHVTLISGPTALSVPAACRCIHVKTAAQMQQAVEHELAQHTVFISAAAVSDYYLPQPETQKIKKQSQLNLSLEKTPDILGLACQRKNRPFCVGFAAETQDLVANAQKKLKDKQADLIIANDVSQTHIGFESDDNAVTIVSSTEAIVIPSAPKIKIAEEILHRVATYLT